MANQAPEEIEIFAVDADIVAYRCASVCEGATFPALKSVLDEFIWNITRETGIKKMAMFLSGPSNKCYRHRFAKTKEYKGNRKNIVRPFWINEAKQYIVEEYGGYLIEEYEADDLIASYMTQHKHVAHAGIDKDIRQIQGWHYDFVKRIWERTDAEDSILRLYRQICMGDTTDNIPGLPNIGKVKAERAITNPQTASEDAFMLYQNVLEPLGMSDSDIHAFFTEQSMLITMTDDIPLDLKLFVKIKVPKMFTVIANGWTGEDEISKVEVAI